ncbi:hypothetical protein NE237_014956 [Protea cynaroides]|uniref:Uncharacterized protein n=1 Tax=Protea cynaroides TaxID=273540 RepID=A0A9Q0KD39_9MAGN|nr:hypothetical protein NE237_014956 [Protea cynaroides]
MDVAVKDILRLCPVKTMIMLYKLLNLDPVDDFAKGYDEQPEVLIQDNEPLKEMNEDGETSQMDRCDEQDAGKTIFKTVIAGRTSSCIRQKASFIQCYREQRGKVRKPNHIVPGDMDADYDFMVDYGSKGSTMEDGDEDNQISGKVPTCGIEFDE